MTTTTTPAPPDFIVQGGEPVGPGWFTTTTSTTTTTAAPTTTTTEHPYSPTRIIDLGLPSQTELCSEIRCGSECEWVFARVTALPKIAGGTRIEWTIHPQFSGIGPYRYNIQFGRTGNPLADDWTTVESGIEDTYYVDLSQRVFGKFQWTHYRVVLITYDSYGWASKPAPLLGKLDKRDWLRAKEIKRLEQLRLKKEAGAEGYLLKRRLFGDECTCLDPITKEIRDPECTVCYGTGIVGGYFDPYYCFYVEMPPDKHRSHTDPSRGTVDDLPVIMGRAVNEPQLFSYDVFVEKDTDIRWCFHRIDSIVEIRGLPLVVGVEMRQLPFTDPAYLFPVD